MRSRSCPSTNQRGFCSKRNPIHVLIRTTRYLENSRAHYPAGCSRLVTNVVLATLFHRTFSNQLVHVTFAILRSCKLIKAAPWHLKAHLEAAHLEDRPKRFAVSTPLQILHLASHLLLSVKFCKVNKYERKKQIILKYNS